MYLFQNYNVYNTLWSANSFYANLGRTIKTLNKCNINLRKKKGKGKKYNNVQKETPNIYLSTRFLLFENRQKYAY